MPMRPCISFMLAALAVLSTSTPTFAELIDSIGDNTDLLLEMEAEQPDFAQIVRAVNERNLDEAARLLKELRASYGEHFKIWEIDGTIKLIENRPIEATAALERALTLAPESVVIVAKLGVALFLQGKLDAAGERLHQANAIEPNNSYVLRYLARVEAARGKFVDATQLYERVIEQMPPVYSPMHSEFANFLIRTGQLQAVNRLLVPLLEGDTPADLHVTLLRAALDTKDEKTARTALEAASARGTNPVDVEFYGALIDRFSGQAHAAVKVLGQLVEDYPENPIFAYEYAVALEITGQAAKGLALVADLARKLPATHVLRLDIAEFMLRNGDAKGASEVLDPSLTDQQDPQAFVLAARAALQTGDSKSANRYAEHVTQKYPALEMGYQLRAHVLQTLGRSAEARNIAEEATILFPESVPALRNYIGLLIIQGEPEAALSASNAALTNHPESLTLLFQAANINEQIGRDGNAEAIYMGLLKDEQMRVPVLNNLALLTGKDPNRLATALDFAEQAFRLDSKWSTIEDTLGWLLHLNGHDEEALERLSSARTKAPNDAEIICHLGIVLAAMEQPDSGETIARCLALDPPGTLADIAGKLRVD